MVMIKKPGNFDDSRPKYNNPSIGLSTRNVFFIIVICACGLLPNPIFNIGQDALWIRNFMVMMKKPENLDFET
jgi:hypothetical protein